jgi:outer membrane protein OmpA-like peptidoglycan-associated protein
MALAMGFAAASATAQTADYRGAGPAVEVDLSVLESLDRPSAAIPPPVVPLAPPVAAPVVRRGPPPAAATAAGPLPPPGAMGLRRMQHQINGWALGYSGGPAAAAPAVPRRPPATPPAVPPHAPATPPRPSPGVAAPPPAVVAPVRRVATQPAVEPLIVAPPPPRVASPPQTELTRAAPPPPPKPPPPAKTPPPKAPVAPVAAAPEPPPPAKTPPPKAPVAPVAAAPEPPPPAKTPPPKAPVVPAAAPPAQPQIAARPPAGSSPGTLLRMGFEPGSSELAKPLRPRLDAIAERLVSDPDMRIQLRAFAAGKKEAANQARRLSLIRALAVRSYLIKQGVRATRMDVRALGNGFGDGPPDRVDVVLAER